MRGKAECELRLGANDLQITSLADADWAGGVDGLSVTGDAIRLSGASIHLFRFR